MKTKNFNGKAIYNPSGKAGEYSYWACNFYVGCSNGCTYCYLRKGVLAGTMGGNVPTLKKCFKDESHALEVFEKELLANLPELQKHGLFFTFTSDPMLQATNKLTRLAMRKCLSYDIPVKLLTKMADWVDDFLNAPDYYISGRSDWLIDDDTIFGKIAFGFTLTGHDELEPNASTNAERIEAMHKLHDAGFKTWASIEPVIDIKSSSRMIGLTHSFCDLYKVGIESGKKYDAKDLLSFIYWTSGSNRPFYFKDSLLKAAGISREDLPANCVGRDYNIFNS